MKIIGLLIIAAALLLPWYWFSPLAGKHGSIAVFSQYIGYVALVAMGLSQLLATKFRWLEIVFGGLDRIYVLHKWLGVLALSTILLHDTIDADIDGLGRETWLTEVAETFGEFALYSLLILTVITIATFVPYQIWKLTHKFMGALFALSAFHYFFITKPFSVWDPVGLYVNFFCVLGILCYLYTLVPAHVFQMRNRYKVSAVEPTGDSFAISLAPEKKGIRYRAGQFAFVRFDIPDHKEVHPFTISQAPTGNGDLRFTIKPLGGGTVNLKNGIALGTNVRVSPAYGHFTQAKSANTNVWIAGGIGITPFLALAQSLTGDSAPTHLFYCVKTRANAAHLSELEALADKLSNFNLHVIASQTDGRLSVETIEAKIDVPISTTITYFCGAEAMRDSLKQALKEKGLPARNFKFEEFEIRSGIIAIPVLTKLSKLLYDYVVRFISLRGKRTS